MRKQLKHLPKPVARTILAFYRRQRFYGLIRSLVMPLLSFAVLALVAMHVDRFMFLELGARRLLSFLSVGVSVGVALVALVIHLWRRLSVSRVAYELEGMMPKSADERLVTIDSVLAAREGGTGPESDVHVALVEQLTAETEALCRETPHAGRLARDHRLRRQLRVLLMLAAVWVVFWALPGYQFPLMLQRLMQPGKNLPKPSFMKLTVTPEAAVIGRNGEVVIQAALAGEIPALLRRPLRWLGADSDVSLLATATGNVTRVTMGDGAWAMSRVQRRLHVASISDVQESFSYRVRCGDAQTDIRFVRVVPQPRVSALAIEADPPAYTKLAQMRVEQPQQAVQVFAGSRVRVHFSSDQASLQSAQLIDPADDRVIADLKADPETGDYLYAFEMKDTIEMEVRLVNSDGFANVDRVFFSLALLEDEPPGVRVEYPTADITVVQGDLVPIDVSLTDDLGLLEAAIRYQVNPEQTRGTTGREIALSIDPTRTEQRVSAQLDLETIGVAPGDEILFWVRARDTGLNDQQSRSVRIRVTAFGGNENERRRLAALRLLAKALSEATEAKEGSSLVALDPNAYEQIVSMAKTMGLVLAAHPTLESLLGLLEREHHFTDSAAATEDIRLLYGMIAALALPPLKDAAGFGDYEMRAAAMKALSEDRLPAMIGERQGRDMIRRCFSLKSEVMGTLAPSGEQAAQVRAPSGRRAALLLEAIDALASDMGALARTSPQLDAQAVLGVSREIALAKRNLATASPEGRVAIADSMDASLSKWIGPLLRAMPEWHDQHLAVRAFLQSEEQRVRIPLESAWRQPGRMMPAAVGAWLKADARMVERSPFLGLDRRLAVLAPQAAKDAGGMTVEATLLRRMAVESEYAQWLQGSRVSPAERQLAVALMGLDLASDDTSLHAAAERVRTLNFDAVEQVVVDVTLSSVPGDLHKQLRDMSRAVAPSMPYDEALTVLADEGRALVDNLVQQLGSEGATDQAGLARALLALDAGLSRWESSILSVSYRMHLDLSYRNPARAETLRLVAGLSALRKLIERYRASVPPVIAGIQQRARRTSQDPREVMALQLDIQELTQRVGGLVAAMKGVIAQVRGETEPGALSAAVRECLIACAALWKLNESEDPVGVAKAFFAEYPGAGAVVLEQRLTSIDSLQVHIADADGMLRAEKVDRAKFVKTIGAARSIAQDLEQVFRRFAALDADGAIRVVIADINNRVGQLEQGRGPGGDDLSRDRLTLDELRRQVEQFVGRTRELVAANRPASASGWWGGPAGIWNADSQRDAQHARARIRAQYEHARRIAVLGLDATLEDEASGSSSGLPSEPLNAILFAWRTLNSSLGDVAFRRPPTDTPIEEADPLVKWLLEELGKSRKALQQKDGVKRYREPMSRWVDSAEGILRR